MLLQRVFIALNTFNDIKWRNWGWLNTQPTDHQHLSTPMVIQLMQTGVEINFKITVGDPLLFEIRKNGNTYRSKNRVIITNIFSKILHLLWKIRHLLNFFFWVWVSLDFQDAVHILFQLWNTDIRSFMLFWCQ